MEIGNEIGQKIRVCIAYNQFLRHFALRWFCIHNFYNNILCIGCGYNYKTTVGKPEIGV